MTYTITSQCIGCDRCLSVCPTHAIQQQGDHYSINSDLCNNCVGYYSVAQCAATCPTNKGCISGSTIAFSQQGLLDSTDYWERWFSTYNCMMSRLRRSKNAQYWEHWFDAYSHKLSKLLATRPPQLSEI
jgi:ferredoxin